MALDSSTFHGRAAAGAWRWRREAAVVAGVAATGGIPMAIPATRRRVARALRHARSRRLLLAGFRELKVANAEGRMPRIRRVQEMPFGERIHLRARAGHWADLLEVRSAALAAATHASNVRVDVDPDRANRITLDIVRRDPLANIDVTWSGLAAATLSMWDPIHLGLTDMGVPLEVVLAERSLLVAGNPGTGKSTTLRTVASHAAKSRCHMVCIDPNQVQFAPWRDRALAYAAQDQDDALAALLLVQQEMQRRLDLLTSLPGCPDKVTPELADEYDLDPWVLFADELAYHTSIAPDGQKRAAFSSMLRDILARGRAALVIPVVAAQRPTDKVIPRDLSELFALRLAFRTATAGSSDVVLGDGMAKRGWDASKIPLTARGVGLLLAEDAKPVRLKGARIPTETVAELSVTTVQFKPGRPRLSLVSDAA